MASIKFLPTSVLTGALVLSGCSSVTPFEVEKQSINQIQDRDMRASSIEELPAKENKEQIEKAYLLAKHDLLYRPEQLHSSGRKLFELTRDLPLKDIPFEYQMMNSLYGYVSGQPVKAAYTVRKAAELCSLIKNPFHSGQSAKEHTMKNFFALACATRLAGDKTGSANWVQEGLFLANQLPSQPYLDNDVSPENNGAILIFLRRLAQEHGIQLLPSQL